MTVHGASSDPASELVAAVRARQFQVFPVGHSPERTVLYGVMDWEGEDVGPFLDTAQKVGAGMIYLRVERLDASEYEEDPEITPHDGEVGLVEVSFLRDNLFHRFRWHAEWAEDLFEEEEPEAVGEGVAAEEVEDAGELTILSRRAVTPTQDRELVSALGGQADKLVGEFVESVLGPEAVAPSPDNEWEVRRALLGFLGEKLSIPSLLPGSEGQGFLVGVNLSPSAEKAVKAAVAAASRDIRARERAIIGPLVKPCLEWALAEEIPLRSLNVSRLKEFLQSRSVSVSSAAVRELRDKVSVEMKRAKGAASHHASI